MHSASFRDDAWHLPNLLLMLETENGMSFVPAQSGAQQRPLPVVAVQCEADLGLRRALLQDLAETVPSHLYHINPSPVPTETLKSHLNLAGNDNARLSRQCDGVGETVARSDLSDTHRALRLVVASAGRRDVLRMHVELHPLTETGPIHV